MFAPKMVSSSVQLNYRADDGFSSKAAYSSKRRGSPESCLTSVADEIGRLAELFGFGDDVETAIKEARQRVRDWRANQEQPRMTPPAALAPSVALERLEQAAANTDLLRTDLRRVMREVAATLRASLAQQGEAVACDVVDDDGMTIASRVTIKYADEILRKDKYSDCRKTNFLFAHPAAVAVDEAMVERAIVAGMATRPREYPPNWPGDYDADEQEHGRNFMRVALTAALQPAATSEGENNE